MATNTSIQLTSLDVPSLEADLKAFMQGQTAFKDYNFDGSNLSALIRLLSYNTFKNAFYMNMIASESFLDSAQARSSIISHSKELNYTPRSARSAKASISFSFSGSQGTYILQKGQTFSAVVMNRSLVFSLPDSIIVSSSNGLYQVTTDIYEGAYLTDSYVINYGDEGQRLIMSNPNIDTSSLTVVVFQDGDVQGQPYTLSTTLLDLDETSKVYFLQASETGQYEVVFGDGVVGYRPPDGSTVLLDYRVTLGPMANGAKAFSIDFQIGNDVNNVSRIVTNAIAAGGDVAETNDSIKYYAPRHFQIQERAVTAPDFATLLKMQFPEIRAVSAYGGEDATPPQFGTVIVAVDISNVTGIPDSKRDEYTVFLQSRCPLTITVKFVEPQYTYLSIRSTVTYNINITTLTPDNITGLVYNAVNQYANTNLNDFEATMRYSRLVAAIDNSDISIIGNETSVQVYKKIQPTRGYAQDITLNYAMPLYNGYPAAANVIPISETRTIRSGQFAHAVGLAYISDDGNGKLWICTDSGNQTFLVQQTGTVDYAKGVLNITSFTPTDYPGNDLKIYAQTAEQDIISQQDTILAVESNEILFTVDATRE